MDRGNADRWRMFGILCLILLDRDRERESVCVSYYNVDHSESSTEHGKRERSAERAVGKNSDSDADHTHPTRCYVLLNDLARNEPE